ncbi:hypothetical protein LCGC14_1218930 [marine sediment metagenome]|uniref:Uncharacterized protein n=1 Tax=marine sediment metagenome TaxID=412755 RepID=A0A0F9LFX9_9ZZZZ
MVEVNNLSNKDGKEMVVTKAQADFLEFCKKYGWGKLEVTIVRGEPVASKELERTHRHDM